MDHRAYEGSVGMLNTPYVKKDTIKNFFPMLNIKLIFFFIY